MITKSIASPYEVMLQYKNKEYTRVIDTGKSPPWEKELYKAFPGSYFLIGPTTLVEW